MAFTTGTLGPRAPKVTVGACWVQPRPRLRMPADHPVVTRDGFQCLVEVRGAGEQDAHARERREDRLGYRSRKRWGSRYASRARLARSSRRRRLQRTRFAHAHPVGYTRHAIEYSADRRVRALVQGSRDAPRGSEQSVLASVQLSLGNYGDIKPVGEGVSELRVQFGPGYRVDLTQRGDTLVILLAGGDKSTQRSDIERAQELARGL